MRYYIGIDLGTSSLKGILTDANGNIYRESSEKYPVIYLKDGWTEQNPSDWLSAMKKVLNYLTNGIENEVYAISFGGQMHGLVVLDKDDNVIRPCILWNDGRTKKQNDYLNDVIGKEKLSELTGNISFAGFTAPKLLWLRENEPENFKKISKIMLPKDYLAYILTGVFSTDFSDASGTLLLDVKNKCYSKEMCDICGISISQLPPLYESYEVTGKVKSNFGLPNCIVCAGASDNAAAAIGTGTIKNGSCNISLGTSGTVFIANDKFSVDLKNALHSFAHANGKFHLMGCILSAASARKWWLEDILLSCDYDLDEVEAKGADSSDVIFLPYLCGERCPHNDTNARGAFIGLSSNTSKAQMSRAVMEGVAFALRDCLETASQIGIYPKETTICGGGAKSKFWCQIIADVLGITVYTLKTEQGPALGAAMLGAVACGEFPSLENAAEHWVTKKEKFVPDKMSQNRYYELYQKYRQIYPLLKCLM